MRNHDLLLLARYNQHMNHSLINATSTLPLSAIREDKGAFFSSILGSFNHILVGDTIWLNRFRHTYDPQNKLAVLDQLPLPKGLNDLIFDDWDDFKTARAAVDDAILDWVPSLTDEMLGAHLSYKNTKGISADKAFYPLLQHFFNHQTHHRGQITTLLNQSGVESGVTDLLVLID